MNANPLLQPFSIEWPSAPLLPTITFEESKARQADELAEHFSTCGKSRDAKLFKREAHQWRKGRWAKAESSDYLDVSLEVCKTLDALISRSADDHNARAYLRLFAEKILTGLCHTAATKTPQRGTLNANALVLHELAATGVDCLNKLAREKPEVLTPFSQFAAQWPATIGTHPDDHEQNKQLLARLRVGARSELRVIGNAKGKLWSTKTPANKLAIRLFIYISGWKNEYKLRTTIAKHDAVKLPAWVAKARRLPALCESPEVVAKWTKIAWEILCELTEGKPDCHPGLQCLKTVRDKYPAHIRDAMKARLARAFATIARSQ